MLTTAITFCPVQAYELERFLAFAATNTSFKKIIVLALPHRVALANAVAARHPEITCNIHRYPLTPEFPDYYDPVRVNELPSDLVGQARHAAGVVLVSGAAVPFPVMQTIYEPPIKPQYNFFKILKALGSGPMYVFRLNVLEKIQIPFLLDNFAGIHKGQRCFVVGNGPSLKQLDMHRLKNEITFGANKVYLGFKDWGFAFPYWGILDNRQVELYPDEWEKHLPKRVIKFFPFEYLKVLNFNNSCPVNTYHTGNTAYPHNFMDPRRNRRDFSAEYMFSIKPDVIYLGHTVTYMLLQIAAVMGCNPIYLIGVDHRFKITEEDRRRGYWTNEKGENHFHQGYSANKIFNLPDDQKATAFFDHAMKYCRANGIEIYNATPGTALKSFPLVEYNSLFHRSRRRLLDKKLRLLKDPKSVSELCGTGETVMNLPGFVKKANRTCNGKNITILLCLTNSLTCLHAVKNAIARNTNAGNYMLISTKIYKDPYFNLPSALNLCLAGSVKEYLVCLRDDVVLYPGWLETLLDVAEENSLAGAVGYRIAKTGKNGCYQRRFQQVPGAPIAWSAAVPYDCALFRKTELRFNEQYIGQYFDLDYCFRLWEAGYTVEIIPQDIRYVDRPDVPATHEPVTLRRICNYDEAVFMKTWHASGRWKMLAGEISGKISQFDGQGKISVKTLETSTSQLLEESLLKLLVCARIQELYWSCPNGVAVFGAGKHAVWLEQILQAEKKTPRIIAILDDQPAGKSSLFGITPINAEGFDVGVVEAIILSTDCRQNEMAERCRQLYGKNIRLIDLYKDLPPGPYQK